MSDDANTLYIDGTAWQQFDGSFGMFFPVCHNYFDCSNFAECDFLSGLSHALLPLTPDSPSLNSVSDAETKASPICLMLLISACSIPVELHGARLTEVIEYIAGTAIRSSVCGAGEIKRGLFSV